MSVPNTRSATNISTDQDFENLMNEIKEMSGNARHVLDETIAAIRDLQDCHVDPCLRRVIHRVFERTVNEQFTDEHATSTQLPERLLPYTIPNPKGISLPAPLATSEINLNEVLDARRSRRTYANVPMSLEEVSTILHTALKSNATENGYGTRNIPQMPYPNIGGLDPVEVGITVFSVDDLEPGFYNYDKVGHTLIPEIRGDMRLALLNTTFENDWMYYAPIVLVLSVNMDKIVWKYKTRGYRIAHIDLGAAMQNVYLACTAYGLSCCAVAAYHDEDINKLFHFPMGDMAVGILIPIGHHANIRER